jgi:hypothetical protein
MKAEVLVNVIPDIDKSNLEDACPKINEIGSCH